MGSLFGSLFRVAVPVFKSTVAPALKRGAKALAKEVISKGPQMVTDALSDQGVPPSKRAKMATSRLINKGAKGLRDMIDNPQPVKQRKTIKRSRRSARKPVRQLNRKTTIFD